MGTIVAVDRFGNPEGIGKPVGQDAQFDRPNVVSEVGEQGASLRLRAMLDEAVESVPDCPGKDKLRQLIQLEASRFMDAALNGRAAA